MGKGTMAEHRHEKRVECDETCVLSRGDSHQVATVKNISFGGALVHFYSLPPNLHIGENCSISVNEEFLCEYSCEVVRAEAPNFALMFTGMRTFKIVTH